MKYGFNTLIVLNIIACLFAFIIGSSILVAIAVINLCCCFWLKMQEIDDLVEKKNYLLALGIINFLSFKYNFAFSHLTASSSLVPDTVETGINL